MSDVMELIFIFVAFFVIVALLLCGYVNNKDVVEDYCESQDSTLVDWRDGFLTKYGECDNGQLFRCEVINNYDKWGRVDGYDWGCGAYYTRNGARP